MLSLRNIVLGAIGLMAALMAIAYAVQKLAS
jgi:hypothetical protein